MLEGLARCPWQTFLGRVLKLEALPDPLEGPPRVEAAYRGSLAHDYLERLVGRPVRTLRELVESGVAEPLSEWPPEDEFTRELLAAARRLLRREGIAYPGLAPVLAAAARPYLETARQLHLEDRAEPAVRAAEVYGETTLPDPGGHGRRIFFKADRAELFDGSLRLTDFKTSKPPSSAGDPTQRYKGLLGRMAKGALLQAPVYARAGRELLGGDAVSEGRYLHLSTDVDTDRLVFPLDADDEVATALFEQVAGALLALWDAGGLFPRLERVETEEEPKACDYCDLKEACARGDSGVRRRLREWFRERPAEPRDDGLQRALVAGWRLEAAKWEAT
jgi:hypothetical protein